MTTAFHRIHKWCGSHYEVAALWQTGVKLYLGHHGKECPKIAKSQSTDGTASGSQNAGGNADLHIHTIGNSGQTDGTFLDSSDDSTLPGIEPWDGEEDTDDVKATHPTHNMLPNPPRTDVWGNPFILIVHSNGLHHLPVVACSCGHTRDEDLWYIELGYFPASFSNIQTVFTFGVLRTFRLANLECKTTAYQYFQMLRRLTCPVFPESVAN